MTVVRKILEGVLTSGSTSLSFTDSLIPNSILKVTTTDSTVYPTSQSVTGNTLQLAFTAQNRNIGVSLEIVKQGLDIVDDVISNDTDKALSAKQGKVLKDAIDAIVIPEVPDVINSLDSTSTTDALSAYQGKVLKDDIDSIVIPTVPDELNDLDDVDITSPTNGQALAYNSITQKFTNQSISGGSTTYSADEKTIGTYFGDTLYQRTIQKTGMSRVTSSTVLIPATDLTSLNIDVSKVKKLTYMMKYTVTGYDPLIFTDNIYVNSTSTVMVWFASNAVYYIAQWGTNTSVTVDVDVTIDYIK